MTRPLYTLVTAGAVGGLAVIANSAGMAVEHIAMVGIPAYALGLLDAKVWK